MDASPLLSALKPVAGEDFGANIGAAVRWAQQTYDIGPDRLRPSSLQSWFPFAPYSSMSASAAAISTAR